MMLAHKTRRALYLAIAGVLVAGTVCAGFNFGMTGAVKNKGKKLERKAKEEAERRRLAPAPKPKRDLFIADSSNHRIRKVDTAGVITTVAGDGTAAFGGDGGAATAARLNSPFGIAVDSSGNLFIADLGNQRIRKVDAAGIITTVAGDGTFGFSGDGGPATTAQLNTPVGIAK